eukprot:CAMPEP_0194363248 /NCGR_PEP_ID=MMETSP0174-20130528/11099_1 /TAXON_ID=216777 /ORGANISM="Proboscia alata, Strain PI-D3" /LENGTH=1007 /DNA_ID=CAMNT_0039136599 /DNA_START=173 /DNA_END=3196 /DNA_ORIENTATION=-
MERQQQHLSNHDVRLKEVRRKVSPNERLSMRKLCLILIVCTGNIGVECSKKSNSGAFGVASQSFGKPQASKASECNGDSNSSSVLMSPSTTTRGGSTAPPLSKDEEMNSDSDASATAALSHITDHNEEQHQGRHQQTQLEPHQVSSPVKDSSSTVSYVTKRNGDLVPLDSNHLLQHLTKLASPDLDLTYISLPTLAQKIVSGFYPNITTAEITQLASETAAGMSTQHPDYAKLAGRLCIAGCRKTTPPTFREAIQALHRNNAKDEGGFIASHISNAILDQNNRTLSDKVEAAIVHERDDRLSYFGFKTLERSYLLRDEDSPNNPVIERPQYMFMRVALGIHSDPTTGEINLENAIHTYDAMSLGYFMHASPTLFHSGTKHPQLSSCFLVQMVSDSIVGIYETLSRCAVISKSAGGIGLGVHKIRARGTYIKGTRGVSNGLVPMLRVFDVTSRYVDQGGGKRPGAFAIYIEPWHADVFDVLSLKKNHGKEEQRARDLFYGLWIPDLFMKRVENDEMWSLMCPHQCPGLSECHGDEFETLYAKYEAEGKYTRQVRARELWGSILDAQIETGTPYLLYKDACNKKSNQQNLGTIQCSNLCTEIVQYTDENEVAVCNLASICLPKYIVTKGKSDGSSDGAPYFDHEALHTITKTVTRNLNRVIDINQYPTPQAQTSNMRHRPIGIGVSGLADAFLKLGLPFTSTQAKELNSAIFETLYHAALEASCELAEKEGSYESFEGSPTSRGVLQMDLWGLKDGDTPSHKHFANTSKDSSSNPVAQKYQSDIQRTKGYDWDALRERIRTKGLRNSLLVAPMPTASTSQILGVNECFEPYVSNLYLRRVKAGEFIMANPHLVQDLCDLGLWTPTVRNQIMRDGGSVANIECIPRRLKELYKTVWEIKMKDVIDMAADRARFIDQSQSLNLFIADPTVDKLTAMHFYAWKKGLKTGMYYLRTKPAVNAIQYTVDNNGDPQSKSNNNSSGDADHANDESQLLASNLPTQNMDGECLSCQS